MAEIAVLGSGFAGSLTALILQQMGRDVVVVDRATHPRFAIGESSTPVADMILRDLADRYDLPWLRPLAAYGTWTDTYPHLGVGRKRGFSYFAHEPGQPFTPHPDHGNELLVAASSDDYWSDTHWKRADVDAFLADQVRTAGIPLFENTTITRLEQRDGWVVHGACGEEPVRIRAAFLIDGTGAGSVVPRALEIADQASRLKTCSRALFTHCTNVPSWETVYEAAGGAVQDHPFHCDDAALHHILDGAWLWMLRFDDKVVSAGFMLDARRYPLDQKVPPEAEWQHWMDRYPSLANLFRSARLAEVPGRFIRTGAVQRYAARVAGDDWALLPHTAGFIDPLHSTGIAHSLCGVERLVAIIDKHWQQPSLPTVLHQYQQAVQRELAFIDTLVAVAYASMPDFRCFVASTMLYFAATIHYERERAARQQAGRCSHRLFLCADEASLREAADWALEHVPAVFQNGEVERYVSFIEEAIALYNTAGLFHPAVPNMYHHTVALPV